MTEAGAPAAGAIDRLRLYYERNEQRVAILSFICGFFFDILMSIAPIVARDRPAGPLSRGDLAALTQMFLEEGRPQPDPATFSVGSAGITGTGRRSFTFPRDPANVYTIFFFKSSSLLVSFSFLVFLVFCCGPTSRARSIAGAVLQVHPVSLCTLCFSAKWSDFHRFDRPRGGFSCRYSRAACRCSRRLVAPQALARSLSPGERQMLVPLGGVLVGFPRFLFLQADSPVPLSIPFIGIYHAVEKTQTPTG